MLHVQDDFSINDLSFGTPSKRHEGLNFQQRGREQDQMALNVSASL